MIIPFFARGFQLTDEKAMDGACCLLEQAGNEVVCCRYTDASKSFRRAIAELERAFDCMPFDIELREFDVRNDLAPHVDAQQARRLLYEAAQLFRKRRLNGGVDILLEADQALLRVVCPEEC